MFKLIRDTDDLLKHSEEVWASEGNGSVRHPATDNYSGSYRYPCLGAAILNYSYSGRPRFIYAYCHKNEAKRLVYPRTNKDRNKNSFRFAKNNEALWEMIHADSRLHKAGRGNDRAQARIFDKVCQLVDLNKSFPALYTYRNATMSRDTALFIPLVVPLYIAKKLVYYKPPKKLEGKIAGLVDVEVAGLDVILQAEMVIDLSVRCLGVIRFTRAREQDFLFREHRELDNMNRELHRDIENVTGSDRDYYVKRALRVFIEWRKAQRRMYASRFPENVAEESQPLLRQIRAAGLQ
ncbi:hypothetical protein LCGC14_1779000 [marine sediment metagenome]|uniref:Uncharacterized protein n=1 Tax=marine sediment metagenome TaxID=412755 RepID=A0A0F9GW32_9ZZZZ